MHFIWMCLVVFLSLQRVDAVSAHYRSLRDVPGLLDRNVSTGATSAFSSPAVYKDANKASCYRRQQIVPRHLTPIFAYLQLHVLPFSMLAVVESRYDVLRVHGLFHEFAHKFPKKPYVAVLAVELPRRNGSSDGQGNVRVDPCLCGICRL